MWKLKPASKRIAELDAENEHNIHRRKLEAMAARIDNRPPKSTQHVPMKSKKILEEIKVKAEIQYNNQLLLKKLKEIEEGGKAKKLVRTPSNFMNRLRLEEKIRIEEENQKLLRKLQSARTHYSVQKQQQDYLHSEYLSYQLSENARRIPKPISKASDEPAYASQQKFFKDLRPSTTAGSSRPKLPRPNSANYFSSL